MLKLCEANAIMVQTWEGVLTLPGTVLVGFSERSCPESCKRKLVDKSNGGVRVYIYGTLRNLVRNVSSESVVLSEIEKQQERVPGRYLCCEGQRY
jgi:hypothetical protein